MRKWFLISLVFFLVTNIAFSEEGMWMVDLIEKITLYNMQELGFELTAEDIYSVNNSSMKDAVVIFGDGCTGEIVSSSGLLFTNHHCAEDQVQRHSTLEHNYLKDGFWANSLDQELPNPDLEVRFLKSIEDVTSRIIKDFSDSTSEPDRKILIDERIVTLEQEASDSNKYEARIIPFFAGNRYYLCIYEVYKDVRLVGVPPQSIGNFGDETDNWEWPRHTGDFSIFRVFTAKDGTPATYSKENIPLKSKYFFPISQEGVKKNDFTLVLGYPGQTLRYLHSFGIREMKEIFNLNRIKIRSIALDIIAIDMLDDPKVKIQYTSKYSRISNYYKNSVKQNRNIDQLGIVERKEKEEQEFLKWVASDSSRVRKYGNLLKDIENVYRKKSTLEYQHQFIAETFFRSVDLVEFVAQFRYLLLIMQDRAASDSEMSAEVQQLKQSAEVFFKDYHAPTDKKLMTAMLKLYINTNLRQNRPAIVNKIESKYGNDLDRYSDELFTKSVFTEQTKTFKFLENPSFKVLKNDPAYKFAENISMHYFSDYAALEQLRTEADNLERIYMQALMEMKPDMNFYPDANFTMRFSYGFVDDYFPRDAVYYNYYTTMKGIAEKQDSSNYEFVVPGKLLDLYKQKDFGSYGCGDYMPVCFITNNDITGGNSGSPVLNGKGQIVGLAFDGNSEALSSDFYYEPELQRCICVDARYLLFILDKFANAKYILDELSVVKK